MVPADASAALWGVGSVRRRGSCSRLSDGAMDDLLWFAGLSTETWVIRALWALSAGVVTTDVSQYGWGGHLGGLLPVAGFFTLEHPRLHIKLNEVAALHLCLLAFGRTLLQPGGLLRVRIDNLVARHVHNGFTSRSPALMAEPRRLHMFVASLGLSLRAKWLPSVASVWADALSRMRDLADFPLCPADVAQLDALWFVSTVDMCATAQNTRCAHFSAKQYSPGLEGVNAFSFDCGGGPENPWI